MTSRWIWWLSPAGAVILMVPGPLLFAASMSDASYRDGYRTAKFLTSYTATLLLAGALVFVIGALLPMLRQPASTRAGPFLLDAAQRIRLHHVSHALFWLTLTGYVAFAVSGFANGATIGEIGQIIGDQQNYNGDLKRQFATVPGITTLTQVGIAYTVVATILLLNRPDPRLRRRLRLGLALVLGLALARAFLLTERLAILELLIPVVTLTAVAAVRSRDHRARWAVSLAPLILIPMVVVLFGLFEYSRSWVYFSTRTSQSFTEFTVSRFAGYYVTSYNNAQLALTYDTYRPGRLPYASVEALWTAPGLPQLIGASSVPTPATIPEQYGNPEFNSPCGLAIPFVDYGTAGGLLFFCLAGVVVGLVYRGFRDGRTAAVLVYPVLVTGLFELPRYLYWTQGRTVPALLALLATAWWIRRSPA